jgi:hypothetical protein
VIHSFLGHRRSIYAHFSDLAKMPYLKTRRDKPLFPSPSFLCGSPADALEPSHPSSFPTQRPYEPTTCRNSLILAQRRMYRRPARSGDTSTRLADPTLSCQPYAANGYTAVRARLGSLATCATPNPEASREPRMRGRECTSTKLLHI